MQVLLQEEEAKRRRKQEETRQALEHIKARVSVALEDYNSKNENLPSLIGVDPETNVIDFDSIASPHHLYHLLGDAHIRAKYERRLMIVLVGFEEKCQIKEQVLLSLDDFFQETKSGATEKMMKELESQEGINLDESAVGLKSAIETTTQAATKLTTIAKEISQLLALAAAFPDNKKGKKKLEKALFKAQEDMKHMVENFDILKQELHKSKEDYSETKKMLEAKNIECRKLQKTADQASKLESTNATLMTELTAVTATLKKTQEEFQNLKTAAPPPVTVVAADVTDELKKALESSKKECEKLKIEKEQCKAELQESIEALKNQHELEKTATQLEHEMELRNLRDTIANIETELTAMQEKAAAEELHKVMESEMEKEEEVLPVDQGEGFLDEEEELKEAESAIEETIDYSHVTETPLGEGSTSMDGEAIAIAALQKEYIEKENALKTEMQALHAKSKKIIATLKSDLKDAKENLTNLEKEKNAELTRVIEEFECQKDDLRNELSQADNVNKQLIEEKSNREVEFSNLETKVTNLQAEITHLHTRIADFQAKIADLQAQNTHLKTTSASIQQSNLRSSVVQQDTITRSAQWSEQTDHALVSSPVLSRDATPSIPMEEVIFSPTAISVSHNSTHGSPLFSQSPVFSTKLSPHSLSGQGKLSPMLTINHPIAQDWMKVCDSVMKFKRKLVTTMKKSPRFTELATKETLQDLMSQTNLKFDGNKDFQGQVTQMRFTLSLTLHQLETIICDYLNVATTVPQDNQVISEELAQLRTELDKTRQQNHQAEECFQNEINDNQDTIASLLRKIDNLKSETQQLKQLLNNTNMTVGSVFFTRLDADRNEKTLQEAKKNKQITEEDYQSITTDMNEYMSIPSQQFQGIAHQISEETQVKKAIVKVCQTFSSPEHISRVITMILQLQAKRLKVFHDEMSQLSAKRLGVAKNLHAALTKTEKATGLFLIKPIYPCKPYSSLMVPLHRVPPSFTQSLPPSRNKTENEIHPSLRLIRNIRMQHEQDRSGSLEDCLDTPHSNRPEPRVPFFTQKWTITRSRVQSATVTTSAGVVIPKMIELETTRLREPHPLLKISHKNNNTDAKSKGEPVARRKEKTSVILPPIHIPSVISNKTI